MLLEPDLVRRHLGCWTILLLWVRIDLDIGPCGILLPGVGRGLEVLWLVLLRKADKHGLRLLCRWLLEHDVRLRLREDGVLRYVLKKDLILVRYSRCDVLHLPDDHLLAVAH